MDLAESNNDKPKDGKRREPDRELLIEVGLIETRVALIEEGRLVNIFGEGPSNASLVGAIFLGRVIRVEPALQAAFVQIGRGPDGFLPVADARRLDDDRLFRSSHEAPPPIDQLLSEGETVLVQVTKDAVHDKGPVLSCDIQLPGRFLRFAPFRRGIKVPRSFGDDASRMSIAAQVQSLLANISPVPPRAGERRADEDPAEALGRRKGEGGAIVRPAARNASKDELRLDLDRLRARWIGILKRKESAEASHKPTPSELWREVGPVSRSLRDYIGPSLQRVLINDAGGFAEARGWLTEFAPKMLDRLERFNGPGRLFDEMRVNDELDQAMSPRVPLASGGELVFQETEALTVIDVNSGRYTAARDVERMALDINLEAADEVARQLRLRNIGGIIVIDFIDMRASTDRVRVVAALRIALERDPAQSRVLAMSELGLVEMTRKRTGETLAQRLTDSCAACDGVGRVPAIQPVAADLLRLAEMEAAATPGKRLVIFCAPEVAEFLEREQLIERLSEKTGVPVALHAEPGRGRSVFDVSIGE